MNSLGVIIGRFQVPCMHSAHHELVNHVYAAHPKRLIIFGHSSAPRNTRNPFTLDEQVAYASRLDANWRIDHVQDCATDEEWSSNVDKVIADHLPTGAIATIYGGRDSAIRHYTGKHRIQYFYSDHQHSGTEERKKLVYKDTTEFREGIAYAFQGRFPTSFQTVDMVCVVYRWNFMAADQLIAPSAHIILGRKSSDGDFWRLPGGFVDTTDLSLEAAVKREAKEELGGSLELGHPKYIGSFRIPDVRYRSSVDKVLTAAFYVPVHWGCAIASDDLDAVKELPFTSKTAELIHPMHRPIYLEALKQYGE